MKRVVILIMFLVGDFSLETHDFNIKDYSSSDDWAVLIEKFTLWRETAHL